MSDTRTGAALAADFPVDTAADALATIAKVDSLVKAGVLNGLGLNQVLHSIETYMASKVEAFAAPTLATAGTAGTTTLHYAIVPHYPIATSDAFHAQIMLPGPPPTGRGNSLQNVAAQRTRRYVPLQHETAIATAAAALDATDYVTITTPAAVNIATVLFDVVKTDGAGNILGVVATNVAPGATVNDTGATLAAYTKPNQTEVAWDTARVDAPVTVQLTRETGFDPNTTAGLGGFTN